MWSSVIFELAKFLPASTNVGRLPEKDVKWEINFVTVHHSWFDYN